MWTFTNPHGFVQHLPLDTTSLPQIANAFVQSLSKQKLDHDAAVPFLDHSKQLQIAYVLLPSGQRELLTVQ